MFVSFRSLLTSACAVINGNQLQFNSSCGSVCRACPRGDQDGPIAISVYVLRLQCCKKGLEVPYIILIESKYLYGTPKFQHACLSTHEFTLLVEAIVPFHTRGHPLTALRTACTCNRSFDFRKVIL